MVAAGTKSSPRPRTDPSGAANALTGLAPRFHRHLNNRLVIKTAQTSSALIHYDYSKVEEESAMNIFYVIGVVVVVIVVAGFLGVHL
jgi:hypothetical protein